MWLTRGAGGTSALVDAVAVGEDDLAIAWAAGRSRPLEAVIDKILAMSVPPV